MKLSKYAVPFAVAGLLASGPLMAQENQSSEPQSEQSQPGQANEQQGQNGGGMQNQANGEQGGSNQANAGNQPQGNNQLAAQDVRKIQSYLQNQGYQVRTDGIWGPQTADAVKKFQQANNLQPTGKLDPNTLAQMNIQLTGKMQRAPASQGGNSGSSNELNKGSSSNTDSNPGSNSSNPNLQNGQNGQGGGSGSSDQNQSQ